MGAAAVMGGAAVAETATALPRTAVRNLLVARMSTSSLKVRDASRKHAKNDGWRGRIVRMNRTARGVSMNNSGYQVGLLLPRRGQTG
jgi:hypothetical protein